ncbi:3-hydroxyacyl-ACP dehydratase [Dyadobacter pollutisoli]|uniref:3-hydroxyacyl-ACP dehydratase n=1 Tax=Dyadobacter pollutisoli TaxID=2910158 RepID=A0A9E8NHH7_9BACT|nr:3-hydroxyacyl-ACP dehydratase [Dyadobacter pollutisoli]WAC15081.1 3-hydroxyacyl-ACP dehydratase [Dyadobacter pollutisoli]
MPQNDIFTIIGIDSTADTIASEVRINAEHHLFEGHFPGTPVTPGVIQLQMVKTVLEQHLQKELQLKSVRTCKFLEVLNPNVTPVIRLNIKYKIQEVIEVTASGVFEGTTFFKAQATYQ